MALQIDGKTPGELRVARDDGALAKAGEMRVWDDGRWKIVYESWQPRVVTVSSQNGVWNKRNPTGDLSLVASDLGGVGSLDFIRFSAPVYCDYGTRDTWGAVYPAGTRISQGEVVVPAENYTTHTFTELRT